MKGRKQQQTAARRSKTRPLLLICTALVLVAVLLVGGGIALQLLGQPTKPSHPAASVTVTATCQPSCAPKITTFGLTVEGHQPEDEPQSTVGPTVSFTPPLLGASTELSNPMRGPQYFGGEAPPPGWPLTDRYSRWCWREVEPQKGQINYGLIDQALATAAAAGYTFGFRIMPNFPGHDCLPDYMKGVSYNDQQYLESARALFTALAQRYNTDPRLSWLDMSLYGCWGEWNEACGGETMTPENRQALIDIQVQAFSNKRFFMMVSHQDSLNYALSLQRAYPIGIRIDCLGTPGIGGGKEVLDGNPLAGARWQTAPLYFEFCPDADFTQALQDVKTYHASIIGDGGGNISGFDGLNAQQKALLTEIYRVSGYRLSLKSISLPGMLLVGQPFTVTAQWINTNIAPTYHPWQVLLQLRNASGVVAWQQSSQVDLRSVFPGEPLSVSDQFMLPANLAKGDYTVTVQVVDPNQYYAPLELANQGRQNDGSYPLGTVKVQ
uniref:DUF4832 domain-containing protein n=1 Tax=Thermosporothrix sp. COM3 TaxID=2490863 RepID=A0A455SV95_9CHLR|nr:DUF4832 domain-containing protein [Thermosporothrix sp. COM3]